MTDHRIACTHAPAPRLRLVASSPRRPPASGIVHAGGQALRYRNDRSRYWSFLDHRAADAAVPTGIVYRFTAQAQRAGLVLLPFPCGMVRCLLWELDGVDLVVGREALGGAAPSLHLVASTGGEPDRSEAH